MLEICVVGDLLIVICMDFNYITSLASCSAIIEGNADFVRFIYYSHIPVSILALFVGILVFLKNPKESLNRALLAISLSFFLWVVLDLIAWLSTDSRYIMFAWSLQGLVNSLLFIICFYFVYLFVKGQDISLRTKVLLGVALLPLIIFTPTYWNLNGFNIDTCEANEGKYFLNYYYFLNLVTFLLILGTEVVGYRKSEKASRIKILLLSLGVDLFLLSFFVTGYLASLLENFNLAVYGLFGMVLFIAFLAYLIVKYQAFNIKLIAAQALVMSLVILIGSQFFFIKTHTNMVLTGITLALASGFGWFLVRSVKQEVERKEELQAVTIRLANANVELKRLDLAKSEFISIASHQLRTPLTAIKGYVSLILEGSYGSVSATVQDILDKVYTVNNRMSQLVEDLLSISRIESGRVNYTFGPVQLEALVAEIVDVFFVMAKNKNITLTMKLPKVPLPALTLDGNKIKEVVSNLIDNSLKYNSPKGKVTVSLEQQGEFACILVEDTGIGVKPEDIRRIFDKFTRSSETMRIDVSGTGLGLYVGKNFVEAHGGRIDVESEGSSKGTRFTVRLPLSRAVIKDTGEAPLEEKS